MAVNVSKEMRIKAVDLFNDECEQREKALGKWSELTQDQRMAIVRESEDAVKAKFGFTIRDMFI